MPTRPLNEPPAGAYWQSIDSEPAAYRFAAAARVFAQARGFGDADSSLVSLAVSEVAMNAVRHAGHGEGCFGLTRNGLGVSVWVRDAGPGIADVDMAAVDGFSTHPQGLGLGLGAARRSADIFRIRTGPAQGTMVQLEKYLPPDPAIAAFGWRSYADPDLIEHLSNVIVKTYEGERALVIVLLDARGQPRLRPPTLDALAALVDVYFSAPLRDIAREVEQHLSPCEGGALSLALVRIDRTSLAFLASGEVQLQCWPASLAAGLQRDEDAATSTDAPERQCPRPEHFRLLLTNAGFPRVDEAFLADTGNDARSMAVELMNLPLDLAREPAGRTIALIAEGAA